MTNETTNFIEQLRKYDGFDGMTGYGRSEEVDEIEGLLYDAKSTKVYKEYEDGGRWTNYETTVHKIEENGKVAYFEISREVPATEMQEGGEFSYSFNEVVPEEVTVIKYVGGKSE
ncbi:hypothetical protein ACIQXW_23700 [Lysinibacillus sp. NPDC097162]|uniref:hypothetical protein n=1 Tax=Lysinibacillus sp. NPDC097162 TaxID=3364140 RepID=UPI00382B45FD